MPELNYKQRLQNINQNLQNIENVTNQLIVITNNLPEDLTGRHKKI